MALVAFGPAKESNDIRTRHMAAQPARDDFAFLDPANALLDNGGMGRSIYCGRSAPADSVFGVGDELLLPLDLLFVALVPSGVTIGIRSCTAPGILLCVAGSMRLDCLARRSCSRCQNAARARAVGEFSTEPRLAICSCRTLPSIRRVSAKLS